MARAAPPGGGPDPAPNHTVAMPSLGDPISPPPFGAGGPPKHAKKNPWVPILAATTALFFLVAAGLALFLGPKLYDGGKLNDQQQETLGEQQEAIAAYKKQLKANKKQIAALKEDLEDAEDKLSRARKTSKGLASDKAIISKCLTLMNEYLTALSNNDSQTAGAKAQELQQPCKDAEEVM